MRCWVLFCILNLAAALTLHDSSDIEAEAGQKEWANCGRLRSHCLPLLQGQPLGQGDAEDPAAMQRML